MGNSYSNEEEWLKTMENYEYRSYSLSELDMEKLERRYTMIEMEGKPFRVRTVIYGKKEEGKKTLVLTHSYLATSTYWSILLEPLSQHYRIVMFDHGSWGLNTRL